MKKNIVLHTKDLNIGYSNKTIASEISVEIAQGELVAVIGINGSGKSTFLKTITGNLPKKSGEIKLKNRELESLGDQEIAKSISVVLSNPVFSQNLSVFEVIALGRHPYTNWLGQLSEKDKKIVFKALKLVEIPNLAKRKCSQLSDGQRQKVFIARALAQDTSLIVLDEPTNHLDLYQKAFVFNLLKNLSRQTEKAIILATHELNLALQLCDKLILIKDGEAIFGKPKELIQNKSLENLFPKDLISFDPKSLNFKINSKFD